MLPVVFVDINPGIVRLLPVIVPLELILPEAVILPTASISNTAFSGPLNTSEGEI